MKFDTILIDFDSTFTQVEALDLLAEIVNAKNKNGFNIQEKIAAITLNAMNGSLLFDKALKQRLDLLQFTKQDLEKLIKILKTKISLSFIKNHSFLKKNASRIYIISGGFSEFIIPIVSELGIDKNHVYANTFQFNESGQVIGFDTLNPLSQSGGKVKLVNSLQLKGRTCIIGDGYTDYELKEAACADAFYLFTENIERTHLIDKADQVLRSLDEFISLQL